MSALPKIRALYDSMSPRRRELVDRVARSILGELTEAEQTQLLADLRAELGQHRAIATGGAS